MPSVAAPRRRALGERRARELAEPDRGVGHPTARAGSRPGAGAPRWRSSTAPATPSRVRWVRMGSLRHRPSSLSVSAPATSVPTPAARSSAAARRSRTNGSLGRSEHQDPAGVVADGVGASRDQSHAVLLPYRRRGHAQTPVRSADAARRDGRPRQPHQTERLLRGAVAPCSGSRKYAAPAPMTTPAATRGDGALGLGRGHETELLGGLRTVGDEQLRRRSERCRRPCARCRRRRPTRLRARRWTIGV